MSVEFFPKAGNGPYKVLRGVAQRLVERLHESCMDPRLAQEERLGQILGQVSGSDFGREHELCPEDTLEVFREKVPIRTGEDFEPWFSRIAQGEEAVLTREPVVSMLETSGTTGPAKLLPVTRSWARTVADAQALWRLALVRDSEAMTRGKVLTIVSPGRHGTLSSGLPYGSNTGRMQRAQPWLVRLRYPVPYEVHAIAQAEARIYTLLRFALQAPVTSITTANPSTLLLMCRKLQEYRQELAADLEEGTLKRGPAGLLEPEERRRWSRCMARCPVPQSWKPADIWNLERLQCWTGGAAPFFLRLLPEAMGADIPVRDVGITASEGFFAIPMEDGQAGALTWLGGHLLEFVDESGEVLWAWQLEVGRSYRLVITTSAGLVRYDMDDVVEVTGHAGGVPLLRFVRRGRNVLNVTGEKLTENQVVQAARTVLSTRGVSGFTAGHHLAEVPHIRFAVEGLAESMMMDVARELDAALCESNIEYAQKRDGGRLGPVEVVVLPRGTYARYRQARVAEGAGATQVKDPVVALDEQAWGALFTAADFED